MEIPQEGKYVCKLNGPLVIYEASTGSLCAAVPSVMVGSATLPMKASRSSTRWCWSKRMEPS